MIPNTRSGGTIDFTINPMKPGIRSVHLRLKVSLTTPFFDTTCTRAAGVVKKIRMITETVKMTNLIKLLVTAKFLMCIQLMSLM